MKKIIFGLLAIAVAIFVMLNLFGQPWALKQVQGDEGVEKPTIKIGIIYPMSGDAAHMGASAKVGVKMFEAAVVGDKNNYEVFIEDNQMNSSKSVMIAKKMIEVDEVDAIITIGSNIGNAVSPLTQKAGVFHFAISSDENVSKGDYNFLAATPNAVMVEGFMEQLHKRGIKNIALVTQNQAAMLAYDKEFMEVNKDINVLSHNYINNGERDFRILIMKILADKPDLVVPLVYLPEITVFVKQLQEAKPDVAVANLESLSYPEDKSLFNGYWFVDGAVPTKAFLEKFEGIKGDDDYGYTPYMYASLEVLRDGFEKMGNNKAEIIKYINDGKKFDTALGKVYFNEKGIMHTPVSVKMIKDGKPVVIEE